MNYTKYVRREQIRIELEAKGFVTTTALMEKYDVSKTTILHDMSVLTHVCNFSSQPGRRGGYYMKPRIACVSA